MTEQMYRRFPDRIEAIEALLRKDAVFREICADYEKLNAWLAENCRSEGCSSEKCDRARELIGELEGEIIEALRESE